MPPAGDVGTVSRKSSGRLVILCSIPRIRTDGGRAATLLHVCAVPSGFGCFLTWCLPPSRIGAHIIVLGWAFTFYCLVETPVVCCAGASYHMFI